MTRLRHALDFVLGSDGVELATGPEVIRCDKAERELCHLPPPTAAEPLEPWSPWREPRKWWPCASRGTPSASWAKTCCVAVRSAKTKLSWMLSILGELFL